MKSYAVGYLGLIKVNGNFLFINMSDAQGILPSRKKGAAYGGGGGGG